MPRREGGLVVKGHRSNAQPEDEAEKLRVLRKLVKEGTDDLDAGRYVEVADSELEAHFEKLTARALAQVQRKRSADR
jgi:hypothetical protein